MSEKIETGVHTLEEAEKKAGDAQACASFYGGEGQSVFPIPFPFTSSSHIRACLTGANGGTCGLIAGRDFTVNMISDGNGEFILLGDALPLGWKLTVKRLVPVTGGLPFPGKGNKRPRAKRSRRVFLGSSGVYHAVGCGFAKGNGEWVEIAVLEKMGGDVRPCLRCRPGSL